MIVVIVVPILSEKPRGEAAGVGKGKKQPTASGQQRRRQPQKSDGVIDVFEDIECGHDREVTGLGLAKLGQCRVDKTFIRREELLEQRAGWLRTKRFNTAPSQI